MYTAMLRINVTIISRISIHNGCSFSGGAALLSASDILHCSFWHTPSMQSSSLMHAFSALHILFKHFLDWQSTPYKHDFPNAHAPHTPPQSTSVSMPFFMPSVHVVASDIDSSSHVSCSSGFGTSFTWMPLFL